MAILAASVACGGTGGGPRGGPDDERREEPRDLSTPGSDPGRQGLGGPGSDGFYTMSSLRAVTGEQAPESCTPAGSAHAESMSFSWQPVPMQSGDIANIVISPSDPDRMYLAVEVNSQSAYRSFDGGNTWERIHAYDHSKDIAVHPSDPDTVLLGDSQSIWRSATAAAETRGNDLFEVVLENGAQPGPNFTSFSSIAFSPSDHDIVYASVMGGGFGLSGGLLYRSEDAGQTFTQLDGSYPDLNVLLVDPQSPDRLYVGSTSGIYISENGGQTLTQVAPVRQVVDLHTADGTTVLAATNQGVWRSADSGRTWKEHTAGLPSTTVLRVRQSVSAPQTVWATTLDGAARSDDGGVTWRDASGDLPARNLQALAVHPSNPDTAFVATETFTFSVRSPFEAKAGQFYGQGVFRTDDGGVTWRRADSGLIEDRVIEITTHPTRPFEAWAMQQSSRGVYRTRDAGQSWSMSPGLLPHYPMRFRFIPGQPDSVVLTSSHTMQPFGISQDGGVTWHILSEQGFFDAVNRGAHLLDLSRTQGAHIHMHGLAIDPADPDVMYAGSVNDTSPFGQKPLQGAHIFKSVDGGKTWQESDEGFDHEAPTAIHDILVDPSNSQVVYVAASEVEASAGNGLWKSSDAGATWARSDTGMGDSPSVNKVVVQPGNGNLLLAGTKQGLYRSADGGVTWELVQDGFTEDIEIDPSDPRVVYAGSGGRVMLSKDFGVTWADISKGLPPGEIMSLGVNCNGTVVYAGVYNHGIFVSAAPSAGQIPADSATGVQLAAVAPR